MVDAGRAALGFHPGTSADAEWFGDLNRSRFAGPIAPQQRRMSAEMSTDTLAVHAGTYEDPITGAIGTPIFQTSTFRLGADSYEAFEAGAIRDVPIYSRYGSPNQWTVQEKIAALEGAESAVVTASGMSAISASIFALTNKGSHIISGYDIYGGTYNLLREDMPSCGRDVTFVDIVDTDAIRSAMRPETSMILVESLTNPLLKLIDLPSIAEIARENHALFMVDNTFMTPVNRKPHRQGADLVIHSATKYLGGHSDLTSGMVTGKRKFLDRVWSQVLRLGGTADPSVCFMLERGMKTLALRVRQQSGNAAQIAGFLQSHPRIERVFYPTLDRRVRSGDEAVTAPGYGGVVSFQVQGGDDVALDVMHRLCIPYTATSLGGVESLVSMPTNTSHSSLTAKQKASIGIGGGLIRMAVGIEDPHELIADLDQALNSSGSPS